ncbi:F-box protein SKIP14-like protein [Drosera capensis]
MALNLSWSIFKDRLGEERLGLPNGTGSGFLMNGLSEKNGDQIGLWDWGDGFDDSFDYGNGDFSWNDSREPVYRDIIDLLPVDPFGMGISSTFTAITGFLENLEVGNYARGDVMSKTDCSLFDELEAFWDHAMAFQAFPGISDEVGVASRAEEYFMAECWGSSYFGGFEPVYGVEYVQDCCRASILADSQDSLHETGDDAEMGDTHSALSFSLRYLGVHDLLSAEMVCKSLRSAVNYHLLWTIIHIDQPLNDRITDDVLLELSNRAKGDLQYLSLTDCTKITDGGLLQVLSNNLKTTKLSVAGCTRLSIDGVVNCLKIFNTLAITGIKRLRVGGIYGVTQSHFEELRFLVGVTNLTPHMNNKQHFYHRGKSYISLDDDRALDIEMCPRCQNFRLVYDCPLEKCEGRNHETQICKACTLCIPRCVDCGRCIFDGEFEELFCLDFLCSFCGKDQSKCHEAEGKDG